ncbi:MAG: ATP synthase F1 subunit gamma [Candidatus Buchananbacteria bacterium]
MAVSTKTIKKSIRSIGSTKKITKAMEMISAAKMRKAVNSVLASRPYSQNAWTLVVNLAKKVTNAYHPLLQKPQQVNNIAVILVTASRGFCGGYNSQIISQAINFAKTEKENNPEVKIHWLTVGKKGSEFLVRNGQSVTAEFTKSEVVSNSAEASPLAKMVVKDFNQGIYDKVMVAYTDYYSALVQKPKIKQLLPLEPTVDADLGNVGSTSENLPADNLEYLFEPNPAEVLNRFLPHLIEVQLYQAYLEASASEQSARMMAMKNASSAASDMIAALTLAYNQARQASITREIAEITGGKAALE